MLYEVITQAIALVLFLPFDGLAKLYVISALFGLFQGGIVPSYAIIVREYFTPLEAGRRVGTVLMATLFGVITSYSIHYTKLYDYWEKGGWQSTDPLSVNRMFDFPQGIGPKKIYLLYHEELESLVKHFPKLKRARFWMTFSDNYLTHLRVLENVGMTRIDPVTYEGQEIVPIKFLKALLPDPASLGPLTKGRTCIGCLVHGRRGGKEKVAFVYNICDHEACYREVQSQAISYTRITSYNVCYTKLLRAISRSASASRRSSPARRWCRRWPATALHGSRPRGRRCCRQRRPFPGPCGCRAPGSRCRCAPW